MMLRLRQRARMALLATSSVMVMAGCGGVGRNGAAVGTPPSLTGSIPQSAVVYVTRETPYVPDQPEVLEPVPAGVTPKLSAEAVRQRLVASGEFDLRTLADASSFTVKFGLYTSPSTANPHTMPAYVFSGGPFPWSDCPPSTGPPPGGSPPPGLPTPARGEATPSPTPLVGCYVVIVAGSDDASGGLTDFSNKPAP